MWRAPDRTTDPVYAQPCVSHIYVRYFVMTGSEFERRIRKLGRVKGVPVAFDRSHGKGSHGRLYYGDRFTTLKDRKKEIGPAQGHA